MSLRGVLCGCVLGVFACGAGGQQGATVQLGPVQQVASQQVMGTVTGHVTCSDTQQPARFAEVMLVNTEQASGSAGRFGFGRRAMARTDLNGNFITQVEPGDYYVSATATGYVSPVAEMVAEMGSGAVTEDVLRRLQQVHVSDTGGGPVNITLDRGGVISGKLQWDDGSPAAGVNVNAISATSATNTQQQRDVSRILTELGGGFGSFLFQMSDDRGVFRLTGLAPGSYLLRAMVMTPSAIVGSSGFSVRTTNITLYAPGKVRRSEAQTIVLKAGEERDDVMFTIDLSALHTVSGRVGGADGSAVASGVVRLTDSQDSTLSRQAFLQPDGSFVVQWVPAGTYTLSVTGASTSPSMGGFGGRGQSSGGTSFQGFQESLTVSDSDVSGVTVSLVPVTAAAQ